MNTATRDERLECRTTAGVIAKLDAGRAITGESKTEFVEDAVSVKADRLLADRTTFVLNDEQGAAWDRINEAPPRDLPRLRRLLERPPLFTDA